MKPKNEVDISSKVGGRIERVIADLGDRVSSGASLAVVEHREIALQVKQAEAGLSAANVGYKNAKDEYNRGLKLREAGAMSDSQLDGLRARMESAEAQHAQADASVGLAREALRNATISAPIAGVVTRRSVDVGQMVGPGIPVYQVQESSVMKFTAGVEAGDFVSLKKGMPVGVFVDAFPGETFEGVIARISPALDPYTRRANVEIEIKNKSGKLLANMFARGVLEIGKEKDAMAIPSTAVLQDGAVQVVYRVEGDKVVKLPIQVGFKNDRITVLRSGAKVGDAIVVTGQDQLSDGARVRVEQ
jgi:RND family efflux transporter MFP subunit